MTGPEPHGRHGDWLTRLTALFVDAKLAPLLILAAVLTGVLAILATPSEEEPQIVVPMIDIHVTMPGATPKEVENRVIGPMEKILWEIAGVEYVYSTAMAGEALTVVRFRVGENTEKSVLATYTKLYQHLDWIPPGCSRPILKPHSIDDVPVLVAAFWGGAYDSRQLRTMVGAVNDEVRRIPGVAETTITGGRRRAVMVEPDPDRLRAQGLDAVDLLDALGAQNAGRTIGDAFQSGQAVSIRLDNFFRTEKELARAVVAVKNGRPISLADVASVKDGFDEPGDYVFYLPGRGLAGENKDAGPGEAFPAVTLSVAKRTGENATRVAAEALRRIEALRGYLLPADVQVTVTRDYGQTAKHKVDELLKHLALAAVTVGGVVALFLGLRASLVVMVAVPVTLAITLATYWLMGYTLNRVTLFALIFCIGILVDDPIVDVENIVRHLSLPGARGRPLSKVIVEAVGEVRAPLVLATFTVIAAIAPMAYVGGLMGPYMRPMPVGASVAMLLSMAVAFLITPWTAKRTLKAPPEGTRPHGEIPDDAGTRAYRWLMDRLLKRPVWRWSFLAAVLALFLGACALFPAKAVLVKMLPFDNKSEVSVVVDMPRGTTLEETTAASRELARTILARPDVTGAVVYAGTAAPTDFNGLIRHYYLRSGQHEAAITVNLREKGERDRQSHAIAKEIRQALAPIAARYRAKLKTVEAPPGPPVLQTLVAEIYGPTDAGRQAVARQVRDILRETPEVVDVDWYVDDPRPERVIRVERDKALTAGVDPDRALRDVTASVAGTVAGLLHDAAAREDAPIVVRLPLRHRADARDLGALTVRGENGRMVSLDQIASIGEHEEPTALYHKNLLPVVYVTGDVAGREESPIYAMNRVNAAIDALGASGRGAWQTVSRAGLPVLWTAMPDQTADYSLKWDGEWQITYEVFRDMGLAFAVVMVLIYILTVGWFGSYTTPLAIMAPIPLSLIGIIPAHALAGAFFTATSMIGFIAGAGIVVRNSIILVDFIEMRRGEGVGLADAVEEAGAVRFRPMLLTAVSVVAGAFVILFDPIFQGLAISLMAGEVAATVFSRMVVPVLYYLDARRRAA
ncbi:acriflavin resistance protein [Solidesulfovibrio carbinoliphilus subsp. oakridgensis]|uniref:Acriflavin resistance protein n=1 Tax=Solidesulfovibrio carbinoliphilus subsp. oakridgensis TaxID=694327 RepID=G7Q9H8_9BACT|nr:efflux RND transporter permease subunit [Solidesulfovibrio carbinoliphilus]EHJ48618.1 acriflavin resistance protein [Solidesulfovibrio carbinoliphilus subsp. oakridgensis]